FPVLPHNFHVVKIEDGRLKDSTDKAPDPNKKTSLACPLCAGIGLGVGIIVARPSAAQIRAGILSVSHMAAATLGRPARRVRGASAPVRRRGLGASAGRAGIKLRCPCTMTWEWRPSQFQVKKAAVTQAKSRRTKQSTVLDPVIDPKPGASSDQRQIVDTAPHVAAGLKDPVPRGVSAREVLIPLADEYDPTFPNDYEKVRGATQTAGAGKTEIEEREKRRKDRHEARGFSRRPDSDSDEDEDYEPERKKRSRGRAAIPPPTSLVEKHKELPLCRGFKTSLTVFQSCYPSPSVRGRRQTQIPDRPRQLLPPQHGWHTLSVEKTSKRGGKIIVGDATEKDATRKWDSNPLTEIHKCPTKVVLLRNMVGAGEVDEDLEVETKEECEKYGKVGKCVIFEIPGAPNDEAVQIFLEFERVESAIKAVVDLNGRYFGGRVVKACFYNLDKFRVLDLAEEV
ncbi:hypothetical protein EI555_020568, partial [Monodon monoceros]